MLSDALFVFLEVCALLLLAVVSLWAVVKLAGYAATLFEGEPLLPTIRRDVRISRRQFRRMLRPGRPRPTT